MDNRYIPKSVRIEHIRKETPDVRTVSIKYLTNFTPGQFLEISCFGAGEAPISISSPPGEELLEISFRRVGSVTEGLFNLKEGDSIGVRGPFGNGFPAGLSACENIIFVAGGIGMAPLRSLIKSMITKKKAGAGSMTLLYGSRTPDDMLYRKELRSLAKRMKVILTADTASSGWKGRVGVVTRLLGDIEIDPLKTKAVLCGPAIMMRFTAAKLLEIGIKPTDVILSMERYMKCGMGKCGHCYIGDKFVCRDGPVFTYEDLEGLVPWEVL